MSSISIMEPPPSKSFIGSFLGHLPICPRMTEQDRGTAARAQRVGPVPDGAKQLFWGWLVWRAMSGGTRADQSTSAH